MTKNDIRLDCSGWKYNDTDIQKCVDAFSTCQADLRSCFEKGYGKEFKPTELEFEYAERKAIELAFEDCPKECFRDTDAEDFPTERASNGRLLDLASILSSAESFIADCAKTVMEENHPLIQVHFRKAKYNAKHGEIGEEIVAVFSTKDMVENCDGDIMIDGYVHNGQHTEMSAAWAKEQEMATKEEYKDLYNELHNLVGYRMILAA